MVLSFLIPYLPRIEMALTPWADIWPMELTICLGVMRIQTIFHFLGMHWGRAKHKALTHSRLREEEPFHYPTDYIRRLWGYSLPFLQASREAATKPDLWESQKSTGDSIGGQLSLQSCSSSVASSWGPLTFWLSQRTKEHLFSLVEGPC